MFTIVKVTEWMFMDYKIEIWTSKWYLHTSVSKLPLELILGFLSESLNHLMDLAAAVHPIACAEYECPCKRAFSYKINTKYFFEYQEAITDFTIKVHGALFSANTNSRPVCVFESMKNELFLYTIKTHGFTRSKNYCRPAYMSKLL